MRVSFLVTAHCVGLNNLITIIIDLEVLFKVESATPSIIRFRIALFITSEANIYIVIYLAVISGKLKLRKVFCTVKDWTYFGHRRCVLISFIIHEKGIEIDPKRIEAMKRVEAPTCKKDLQKFLGKVNYLRRFVSNLSGKIDAFTPILRLKNEAEFT